MSALLDKQFLADIGVNLDESHTQAFSDTYSMVLHNRVIDSIVHHLSEDQLEDLHYYRLQPDEALQQWLTDNVPDLANIIQAEVETLLGEIVEGSDSF